MKVFDPSQAKAYVEGRWGGDILACMQSYISTENCSPGFPGFHNPEKTWDAVRCLMDWASKQEIPGMQISIERIPGLEPVIFIEVPGPNAEAGTVLLYGHGDKQPPMDGWREGLGPYTPVLEGDKLYGRGGADDGYAIFAALTAITTLVEQDVPYARCVVVIEFAEESGSPGLDQYITKLKDRIRDVSLVVCLDSNAGDYNRLWNTTSLRGLTSGVLRMDVLTDGVHSGKGTGIVPSVFLDVLPDVMSRVYVAGQVTMDELFVTIPPDRWLEATRTAQIVGRELLHFPWFGETWSRDVDEPLHVALLNQTWRPGMTVVAAEGLPGIKGAGNVMLPNLSLKLSCRLPPGIDPEAAGLLIKERIEGTVFKGSNPYNASVTYTPDHGSWGWNAPSLAPWLKTALSEASTAFFGNNFESIGEGGSIPFIKMLGDMFPEAQFVVTGLLGNDAGAHGPNEYLHLPAVKNITCCVAQILAAHASR